MIAPSELVDPGDKELKIGWGTHVTARNLDVRPGQNFFAEASTQVHFSWWKHNYRMFQ